MDRELYMELPPGLQYVMDVSTLARGTVCKLVRGLYGAKQSPALWNQTLDTYLRGLGFVPSANDSCLYFRERTSVPRSSQKEKGAPCGRGHSGKAEKGKEPGKELRAKKGATSRKAKLKGLKKAFQKQNTNETVCILAYVDDCVVTCLAERTKHFDIKYHWLREKVKANQVKLTYINTHEQLADIFTKPLGAMQHHYLRGKCLTGFR